jgi:hypothetical protein
VAEGAIGAAVLLSREPLEHVSMNGGGGGGGLLHIRHSRAPGLSRSNGATQPVAEKSTGQAAAGWPSTNALGALRYIDCDVGGTSTHQRCSDLRKLVATS